MATNVFLLCSENAQAVAADLRKMIEEVPGLGVYEPGTTVKASPSRRGEGTVFLMFLVPCMSPRALRMGIAQLKHYFNHDTRRIGHGSGIDTVIWAEPWRHPSPRKFTIGSENSPSQVEQTLNELAAWIEESQCKA